MKKKKKETSERESWLLEEQNCIIRKLGGLEK